MADVNQNPDETEKPPSKATTVTLALLFGGFMIVAACGCFYLGTAGTAAARVQSADYHRAPNCTLTAVASSGLPPCVFQTMTVTSKNFIDGDDLPDSYKLGLSMPQGAIQEVELFGRDKAELFEHVSVGTPIQVKTWQGQILILTIPGWHCGTPGHPDAEVYTGNQQLWAGGALTVIGGLALFGGWRAYHRKEVPAGTQEIN